MLWAFTGSLGCALLSGIYPPLMIVACAGVLVFWYFVYELADATGSRVPWLYFLTSLIPGLFFIVLLVLNSRATDQLRAAGLRVGLMGVSRDRLRQLEGELAQPSQIQGR